MAEDDAASPSQAEEKEKKTAKKSAPKDKEASKAADDAKVKKKRIKGASNPSTEQMAIEAIENLNESDGSSVQAIKGWIVDNYHLVRPEMLKNMLRRALIKGLEKGIFVRSKEVNTTAVLSGSYRLGAPKKVDRDENLRSSSRIRRLEGRPASNSSKSKKSSKPFGKRSKKKKNVKQEQEAAASSSEAEESAESSENDSEPAKKKARSAPTPRGKSNKKDSISDSPVSPPKGEIKEQKPAEKNKEEKKKSEPIKTESVKSEVKNENSKTPARRNRKKAS